MQAKKRKYITWTAVIVVLAVLFIIIIKGRQDTGGRMALQPLVVPGKLQTSEIERTESLTGNIIPDQQADIFSKVNGNIEKIFVDIGDYVSRNQVLALVDTTIYSQNLKQARGNLMQSEANYQNAKLNFERNKKLFDQNLISQQDLDNMRAAFDISSAQKEAADASFNNAQTQLNYCRITAPFSGVITKRMFDPGAYVTSSANSQSSTLFILMDINNLKTIVNVPERSVPYLKNVIGVVITADAIPGKVFNGKINKISQSIDLATRTMDVEIAIDNTAKQLKPGMFATVQFILEKKTNASVLPTQVVLNDDKGDYVFIINPDTTVTKKYVKTGIKMEDKVEVVDGVNKDDNIVFIGQSLIKEKMKVKITK